MIELGLIVLLLAGLFIWLRPWSVSRRRRQRTVNRKPYWLDGHGY